TPPPLCFRSAPDLLPQTLSRRRSRSRILLHPPLLSHILLHPPLLSAAAIPHPRQPATGQAATKVPPHLLPRRATKYPDHPGRVGQRVFRLRSRTSGARHQGSVRKMKKVLEPTHRAAATKACLSEWLTPRMLESCSYARSCVQAVSEGRESAAYQKSNRWNI
ncbi:unnamed protein product, partial [Urochloa humidicola]